MDTLSEGVTATKVLSFMVFWGQIQNYMMRISISILLVAMIKPSESENTASSGNTFVNITDNVCPDPEHVSIEDVIAKE